MRALACALPWAGVTYTAARTAWRGTKPKDSMRSLYMIAVGLLVSLPGTARGNELSAGKAWAFEELSNEQGIVCRARTLGPAGAPELVLDYPKNQRALPSLILRAPGAASLASVVISRRESEPLFNLSETEGRAEYWYAPLNFARLEKLIRDQNTIVFFLDPKGRAEKIELSLAGSGDALRAAAKCAGRSDEVADFFRALHEEKSSLVPDLGDRSVARMRAATEEAFAAYRAGGEIKTALAALRKPVASLLKKEASAQADLTAASASQSRAAARLAEAEADVVSTKGALAQARAKLAELNAAKPLAEKDLATKKATYLPLREQMKPYESAISSARRSQDAAEDEIKKTEAAIAKNERTIRALESERAGLLRQIPGLESEAASLRVQYSQANSDYSSYNPSWERQRYLDNESRYRWAKSDLSSKESELGRARSDYNSASSRADSARSQLYSCRSQPDANCSSQESQLSSAERERDDAQRKMNSLSSDISSLESDIRRYESDADGKVSSEQSRLRSARDSYAYALSSKESELASAKGRAAEIRSTVPGLRNQVERGRANLPGLRAKLAAAQAEVVRAKEARDAFATSIGFGVAEAAYEEAEATLKSINGGITDNTKAIPKMEKEATRAVREIEPLTKALARAAKVTDEARAKLAAAQAPLAGFRAEEAKLVAKQAEQETRFLTAQAIYQDLYAEWTSR